MRKALKAMTLAGLTVSAAAAMADGPAVAGVIYRFDGAVAGPGDQGPCEPGTCSVAGSIAISTAAFRDGRVDDPTDVTGFAFTVSSPLLGSSFTLDLPDLWTRFTGPSGPDCAISGTCIDLTLGEGGRTLTGGSLMAQDIFAGSVDSVIALRGSGGLWEGVAGSDALPTSTPDLSTFEGGLRLAGSWIRVPAPGALPLLLAGMSVVGLLAGRGRRRRGSGRRAPDEKRSRNRPRGDGGATSERSGP